jgi:hypothetical protein
MNRDIIDQLEESTPIYSVWDIVKRWERKRLTYNLLVGGVGLILAFIEYKLSHYGRNYWNAY